MCTTSLNESRHSNFKVSANGFKKRDISGLLLPYQIPAINLFSFRDLQINGIICAHNMCMSYLIDGGSSLISKCIGQNEHPEDLNTGTPSVFT